MNKKRFLCASTCSLLMMTSIAIINSTNTKTVKALNDLDVDMSTYSIVADKDGGTIIAPYNGIGIVTKSVQSGKTVDIEVPVATSGNIAIELKNFTKNGVNVAVTLKKGEESYQLTDTSKTYTVSKYTNVAKEVTGKSIALPTTGDAATGYEAFNGYVVVPNANEIDSVVVSIPLGAAEKAFMGRVLSVSGEIVADQKVTLGNTLYTPNAANFTATNTDYAYVKYLTKDQTVIGGTPTDDWEESRIYLPNLQEDGTFKLNDYKYLVMDVDFSDREAATAIGFEFFRNNGNKWNADRAQPKTMYAFNDDGTYTTSTIALGKVHSVAAGFKGKLYYPLEESNLAFGANWKDAEVYSGYVFKQMMMYFAGGQNKSNIDKPYTFHMYFTNSDFIQTGDTPYLLTTDVNDQNRGTVVVDTTSGIKITPTPKTDFAVEKVTVNGTKVDLTSGSYQLTSLTANTKVHVDFVGSKTITYSCDNENVTVTADKETIHNDDDVTFNFKVGGAYSIKSIKANGQDIVLDINGNYTVNKIQSNIEFTVETIKAEKVSIDSNNFVFVSDYAGGTVWAPFDGVGIVSKALVSGEKVTVDFPVAIDGDYVAIRVNNLNRSTNTKLDVTLKNGEESYKLTDESNYYLVKDGTAKEYTGKDITLGGTGTAADGYYGFNGYVLIPNDKTIDTVSITLDLAYSDKIFVGGIYAEESSASYLLDETTLKYTPSANNFTVTGNEDNVYVGYLTKNSYLVVGTGTDGWEQSRILLNNLDVDGTFDISKWSYLVMDVDFSARTAKTRIGFEFFRNAGSKYNADRANPATVIAVGDDGSYYTEKIGLGGGWYIPAGFKGKLYYSLDASNMLYGANFTAADSKTSLFKEVMLYALCQNNQGNKGVVSSLDMYFSSDVLPNYETANVTLKVNDVNKGSAKLSTYTSVIKGSSSKVIVSPKVGYLIEKITVNGTEVEFSGTEYTVTDIQADTEVIVSFVNDPTMPKYTWTVTNEDGHAEVMCEDQLIPFGTDAKFVFTTDFGYVVKSVKINDEVVTLTDGYYVLKQVEDEVAIEVVTEVIPALSEASYATELGKSNGTSIMEVDHLNNFYSNYDSVLVSSILYSRETAKLICPQPYVGVRMNGLAVTDFSTADMIFVKYQHYHTQSASASGTGVKVVLVDADGKEVSLTSGSTVYLIDGELSTDSKCYSIASAYVSGGMLFTPFDFAGYLALPKASFTTDGPDAKKDGFDWTNVSGVQFYTDYRWWSDSGARYAISDMYVGNYNSETLLVTTANKIWNGKDGTYNEYLCAYDGNSKPYTATEVKFADFAFTTRLQANRLYFFDFSQDFAKYAKKGIAFNLSKDMATNGYYDFRDVKVIRFVVDNTNNPAIDFGLSFKANNATWSLSNLARVVCYDLDTQEAEYGLKQIPAGFKGYVDIYFEASAFTCDVEDVEFAYWLEETIKLSLPECSANGIPNGTNLAFDCKVLTKNYTFEYETIKTRMFNINYVLNGGTNDTTNPATYAALSEVTLANATKEGYEFQGWYLASDFSGNPISSFSGATGDVTLYAKFGAHFTVTYTIGDNGDVRPRKAEVEAGDSLTILIFPDDGYDIALVKVNGKTVALDENDSFVIEDIQENITIEVEFMEDPDSKEEKDDSSSSTSSSTSESSSSSISESTTDSSSSSSDVVNPVKKGCKGSAAGGLMTLILVGGCLVLKRRQK